MKRNAKGKLAQSSLFKVKCNSVESKKQRMCPGEGKGGKVKSRVKEVR